MRRLKQYLGLAVAAVFGAASFAAPSIADGPYLVGLTGDLSGPASGTYKPMSEAARVYFDNVNANGGINGHKIKLITRDSRSNPNQVATDLNYFNSEGAVAVTFVSPSGTLGAYVKQNATLKVPTLYINACYPPSTPPAADPNFFCPGISTLTDALTTVDLMIALMKKDKFKLAFITTDIPGARGAAEKIMKPYAEKKGIEVVDVAVMPLATSDASTIARSFVDKGVEAVISYTISKHMLAGAEALAKLNWDGKYLLTTGLPGTFDQISQLKSKSLYGFDHFSRLAEGKPIHKEIQAAAKKFGFGYPTDDIRWGYRSAMVLGAGLKKCGWPCSRDKLRKVMNGLTVDSKSMVDLNLNPVIFTKTNHTSPEKLYRVYHWDTKIGGIGVALDNFVVKENNWGGKKKKK